MMIPATMQQLRYFSIPEVGNTNQFGFTPLNSSVPADIYEQNSTGGFALEEERRAGCHGQWDTNQKCSLVATRGVFGLGRPWGM